MERGNGQGYTHFVGVLVPPSLADVVDSCRVWMSGRYGCSSGYRTEPHITLVAPFSLGAPSVHETALASVGSADPEVRLEAALGEWTRAQQPFDARVHGFGAFARRTIFARLEEDTRWQDWHRGVAGAVSKAFPGMLAVDRRVFTPHLTVANRDIPETAFMDALAHFAGLELDEVFPVDHIVLFEWKRTRWEVRTGWEAGAVRE